MKKEVSDFYDDFLDRRMIEYRINGSKRIDAAYNFAYEYLKGRRIVADIGCGIGIFSEKIGNAFPLARVISIDVSKRNIEYARKTIRAENVQFEAVSVTEQFTALQNLAGGVIDAICMIDVIEHIPEDSRQSLLIDLGEICSKDAVLILTYPSPEYQRQLIATNPDELQIIDNVLEINTLMDEARHAGWHLREFRYVNIWQVNQYIHAAFVRRLDLDRLERPVHVVDRIRNLVDRYFLRPRRVKRYGKSSK